jgi:hypothetical protein
MATKKFRESDGAQVGKAEHGPRGNTSQRAEDLAVCSLADYLRDHLKRHQVDHHANLLYRIVVDGHGKSDPSPDQYLKPMRGHNAFQADIVVRSRKNAVPLVAIELKWKAFSTHDVLTYSSKAIRHKEIYPYLRYGFVVLGGMAITDKFFVHNVGFDFAFGIPDTKLGRAELLKCVKRQIKYSERIISISHGDDKNAIRKFETRLHMLSN